MQLHRRRFLHLSAGAAVFPLATSIANAQGYPSRPVRILVGYTAGGTPDIAARLMAQSLSERLGQQFVIENRPGAGTNIATEVVVRAPADGHTLLLIAPPAAINATLYQKLNFDFLRDIAPVGSILRTPEVLVLHPSVPAQTVPELIAYAKANPGKINMGSSGVGSGPHMTGELFKTMAGIDMTHVPYRGGGQVVADVIGNQVQALFIGLAPALAHIRAGKLRALAVTTATRAAALPDVPTVAESVPGFEVSGWFGIGAPKATPPAIVETLSKAMNASLADSSVKARIADIGASPLALSPADFGSLIASETEKWATVIRSAGITAS